MATFGFEAAVNLNGLPSSVEAGDVDHVERHFVRRCDVGNRLVTNQLKTAAQRFVPRNHSAERRLPACDVEVTLNLQGLADVVRGKRRRIELMKKPQALLAV